MSEKQPSKYSNSGTMDSERAKELRAIQEEKRRAAREAASAEAQLKLATPVEGFSTEEILAAMVHVTKRPFNEDSTFLHKKYRKLFESPEDKVLAAFLKELTALQLAREEAQRVEEKVTESGDSVDGQTQNVLALIDELLEKMKEPLP